MQLLEFYKSNLKLNSEDEVFDYFLNTLKPSNTIWSYFVNWEKVFKNTKSIEIALNNLNYLIGKENFDEEFKFLIKENPNLIKVIPALVVRDGSNRQNFEILVDYQNKKLVYKNYDFTKKDVKESDVNDYLLFIKETGLKDLIVNKKIKNLVDYMIGVEAGLDSNGRKNRGGHAMENIVEAFIKSFCQENNLEYLKEANSERIQKEWGYTVPVDKSSRRYDFVVNTGKELLIFETNFYGGGGSKVKSTAGEYRNLYDVLDNKFKFIWITDGLGWKSTAKPLRETFNHNEYIFNLNMLENGILDSIF